MTGKKAHINEDEIINKAIDGDVASLQYLITEYKDAAYTLAVGILKNNEDAEEVIQDAFMKAFASLHKFKKASRFSTWLFRIVYNTAITKLKSRPVPPVQIEVVDEGVWEKLKEGERKKYIQMALSRLSEEERTAITLFYIAGKSISEIERILDVNKSAVKMRLLRGRARLREILGTLLDNEVKDLL